MNYAYLAEDKSTGISKVLYTVSGNSVENCDELRNYDFCSVYKENSINITRMARMKFPAFTDDILHTVCHTGLAVLIM